MKSHKIDLLAMLARGGSWHNIPGSDAAGFINAALMAMSDSGPQDRRHLAEAMIRREAASSTSMGEGLAFPHPLAEGLAQVEESFIAVAYPRFPVPWGASDGIPVKAAFLVVCNDRHNHLLALSALAKLCSRNEVKAALMDEAPVSELITLMDSESV